MVAEGDEKDIIYYHKLFESIYDKYSSKVYGFFLSQTCCEELAEELLIKVFLIVWAHISCFNDHEEKRIIKIGLEILNHFNKLKPSKS